jgi:hypothetical protein
MLLAWETQHSNIQELIELGYDFHGMGDRDANVKPEDEEKVAQLLSSVMGIGWPLKAIFAAIMLSPLSVVAYFIPHVIRYFRGDNKYAQPSKKGET